MAGKYPIECYGMKFDKGSELHVFIERLHCQSFLTTNEHLILNYTYDNGYLAHWDYKRLMKKPIMERAK